LQRLNNLSNPNRIYVGQRLRVPGSGTPSGGTRTYVVQPGDTLSSIARKFGTTTATLQRLNNLSNPNRIYVGQRLIIP